MDNQKFVIIITILVFLNVIYCDDLSRCPEIHSVEFGTIQKFDGFPQMLKIDCNEGYEGSSINHCVNGEWQSQVDCTKMCSPPPTISNGVVNIDGEKDGYDYYSKGVLVTYSCWDGYSLLPPESQYRVCEKGIWTGPEARCVPVVKVTGCSQLKTISNGYFVHERSRGSYDEYSFGQRLYYSCKPGYVLEGSHVQQCLDDGTWSPKIQPKCVEQPTEGFDDFPCETLHIPHTTVTVIQRGQTDASTSDETIVEIQCTGKYRNMNAPCQPAQMRCFNGRWIGVLPKCEPAFECFPPPPVTYATTVNVNFAAFETITTASKYPITAQVSYQCLPGYTLEGNDMLSCLPNGCWLPKDSPVCIRSGDNYYLEVNSLNAIFISAATGAGVLGLLLLICLYVVCKRRKPLTRTVSISPPVQRQNLGDHAALLNPPDRLALIAFADGMQTGSQSSLPTYDEATRERGPGLTVNRLHRPHWPNLAAGRRARNSPNPDMVHVTRHGSFASHTPSTRSAGDSMGSTDTMAVSEGSTNVTLDTASSHSGSQPASCRAHCGSLASFDTSSVINNEDVPLLEESELEEMQVGNDIAIVLDGSTISSDNSSFKFASPTDVP